MAPGLRPDPAVGAHRLFPFESSPSTQSRNCAIVFAATYLVLAIGRLPGFRIDRTGAAIIGAGAMIGFNILTFDEAVNAVDFSTIGLLFGMMIVVANLRLSGFFRLVAAWVVRHAHGPLTLLAGSCSGLRRLLGVLRERHDVHRPDAAGAGRGAGAGPQPGALPACGGDGFKRRQRGDDHGQSAEHDDRELSRIPYASLRLRWRPSPRSTGR